MALSTALNAELSVWSPAGPEAGGGGLGGGLREGDVSMRLSFTSLVVVAVCMTAGSSSSEDGGSLESAVAGSTSLSGLAGSGLSDEGFLRDGSSSYSSLIRFVYVCRCAAASDG